MVCKHNGNIFVCIICHLSFRYSGAKKYLVSHQLCKFYCSSASVLMPLIQVTSGRQRSLLKKKLQVCESQQSCLFVGDQILIFHHNLQINSLKILQCDFLHFFSYFVSHSWGIPMMKMTGLSHLFKWENLHNWWLTKYFFAPLYNWSCPVSTLIPKYGWGNLSKKFCFNLPGLSLVRM